MLVRYMLSSVCLRLGHFSQLPLIQYMGFTQFPCDDRENVYFILLSSPNWKYKALTIV